MSNDIVEVTQRYDDICPGINNVCNIPITISSKMTNPVHLFYQLENFYQNHRIYMKSYSTDQLAGSDLSYGSLSACDPAINVADIGSYFI
jgi:hypothetical protein